MIQFLVFIVVAVRPMQYNTSNIVSEIIAWDLPLHCDTEKVQNIRIKQMDNRHLVAQRLNPTSNPPRFPWRHTPGTKQGSSTQREGASEHDVRRIKGISLGDTIFCSICSISHFPYLYKHCHVVPLVQETPRQVWNLICQRNHNVRGEIQVDMKFYFCRPWIRWWGEVNI